MTPEQARKLLEGTTLAPWEVEMHQESRRPDIATFWIAGRTGDQVAEQETLGRQFDVTESDFNLIAAAPRMAAMIANMTTEYAAQLSDGRLVGAVWSSYETAREDRDAWRRDGYNARIVCRYVTAPQPLGAEQ